MPETPHKATFVYSPLTHSRIHCSRWSMMCSSFHGMGRLSFAVQATAVNHVPGLKCKPCTRFVPTSIVKRRGVGMWPYGKRRTQEKLQHQGQVPGM